MRPGGAMTEAAARRFRRCADARPPASPARAIIVAWRRSRAERRRRRPRDVEGAGGGCGGGRAVAARSAAPAAGARRSAGHRPRRRRRDARRSEDGAGVVGARPTWPRFPRPRLRAWRSGAHCDAPRMAAIHGRREMENFCLDAASTAIERSARLCSGRRSRSRIGAKRSPRCAAGLPADTPAPQDYEFIEAAPGDAGAAGPPAPVGPPRPRKRPARRLSLHVGAGRRRTLPDVRAVVRRPRGGARACRARGGSGAGRETGGGGGAALRRRPRLGRFARAVERRDVVQPRLRHGDAGGRAAPRRQRVLAGHGGARRGISTPPRRSWAAATIAGWTC